MRRYPIKSQNIPWHLIIIFLLLSVGIGASGYLYYKHQREHFKKVAEGELSAIADLKVDQISMWRKERMGDASVIFESFLITSGIQRLLENPKDSKLREEVLSWMTSLKKHYDYESIFLLDPKGKVRLSTPGNNSMICSYIQRAVLESIQTKKIILTDFHRSEPAGGIHLGLVVPIVVPKDRDVFPVAVLLLQIDPYRFLYPFIQSWPTPSPTSEALLIRREENEVVYLNELRQQKNTALSLRFPLGKDKLPAAMAASGKKGLVEGLDYRGVPVLAATRSIPDSPWFLVSKVDQNEIYAPIRQRAKLTAGLTGLLIILAGVSLGLFWRQQRAQFYREQYEKEVERSALTRHLDYLTKYANDIILLMDQDLKILEANERAAESYGYTGRNCFR